MGVWTEEYGTYNETASTLTSASSYSTYEVCPTFSHKSKTDLVDVMQNIDRANDVAMHLNHPFKPSNGKVKYEPRAQDAVYNDQS